MVKRNEVVRSRRNIHSSRVHKTPNVETTQVSVDRWKDNRRRSTPALGAAQLQKQGTATTRGHADESGKHDAQGQRPETKSYRFTLPSLRHAHNRQIHRNRKQRSVCGEEGQGGRDYGRTRAFLPGAENGLRGMAIAAEL